MTINKDTKIGDLLQECPEKACDVHGIDVEELVKQLNA